MLDLLLIKTFRLTVAVATPVLSVLAIRYLNRRWQLQLSRKERRLLQDIAWSGVRFVEQEYRDLEPSPSLNREKYALAARYLQTLASRRGISVDSETTQGIIEAAVFDMKHHRNGRAPKTPQVAEAVVTPATDPRDLTQVVGIGPRVATLLQAAGIDDLGKLASSEPGRLRELLAQAALPFIDPDTWPEQARAYLVGPGAAEQS